MVQQLLTRLASAQGHPQRRFHQALLSMPGHGPAHDEPGIDIQHHRDVDPALSGPHGGDIREPFPIRSKSREIALQQIGSHRIAVATIGGAHAPLLLDSAQARLPHQARDAMFATTDALRPQFGMNTRTAIDRSAMQERLRNVLRQAFILQPFADSAPACARRSSRFPTPLGPVLHPLLWRSETFGLTDQLFMGDRAD
jgi:hypothetical protein